MRIDVTLDTDKLRAQTERQIRNLAFSTAQALNDTAGEVRRQARIEIGRLFKPIVRANAAKGIAKESLFSRAGGTDDKNTADAMRRRFKVLLKADAKQARPFAIVGYRDQRRLKIRDFDSVADQYGRDPILYEVADKKVMSMRDLNLRPVKVTPRGYTPDTQLKGQQKAFGLFQTKTYPKGAVFQRIGPGPGDIRVLISYARWQDERLALKLIKLPELARKVYAEFFRDAFLRRFYKLKK